MRRRWNFGVLNEERDCRALQVKRPNKLWGEYTVMCWTKVSLWLSWVKRVTAARARRPSADSGV